MLKDGLWVETSGVQNLENPVGGPLRRRSKKTSGTDRWRRSTLCHLSHCRRAFVAGIRRTRRFNQQQLDFLSCDGPVFDALRDNIHLAGSKQDAPIAQLDFEISFDDEKEFIRVIVLMPNELVPDFHDHHVVIIECCDGSRRPIFRERRQFFRDSDLVVHVRPTTSKHASQRRDFEWPAQWVDDSSLFLRRPERVPQHGRGHVQGQVAGADDSPLTDEAMKLVGKMQMGYTYALGL